MLLLYLLKGMTSCTTENLIIMTASSVLQINVRIPVVPAGRFL